MVTSSTGRVPSLRRVSAWTHGGVAGANMENDHATSRSHVPPHVRAAHKPNESSPLRRVHHTPPNVAALRAAEHRARTPQPHSVASGSARRALKGGAARSQPQGPTGPKPVPARAAGARPARAVKLASTADTASVLSPTRVAAGAPAADVSRGPSSRSKPGQRSRSAAAKLAHASQDTTRVALPPTLASHSEDRDAAPATAAPGASKKSKSKPKRKKRWRWLWGLLQRNAKRQSPTNSDSSGVSSPRSPASAGVPVTIDMGDGDGSDGDTLTSSGEFDDMGSYDNLLVGEYRTKRHGSDGDLAERRALAVAQHRWPPLVDMQPLSGHGRSPRSVRRAKGAQAVSAAKCVAPSASASAAASNMVSPTGAFSRQSRSRAANAAAAAPSGALRRSSGQHVEARPPTAPDGHRASAHGVAVPPAVPTLRRHSSAPAMDDEDGPPPLEPWDESSPFTLPSMLQTAKPQRRSLTLPLDAAAAEAFLDGPAESFLPVPAAEQAAAAESSAVGDATKTAVLGGRWRGPTSDRSNSDWRAWLLLADVDLIDADRVRAPRVQVTKGQLAGHTRGSSNAPPVGPVIGIGPRRHNRSAGHIQVHSRRSANAERVHPLPRKPAAANAAAAQGAGRGAGAGAKALGPRLSRRQLVGRAAVARASSPRPTVVRHGHIMRLHRKVVQRQAALALQAEVARIAGTKASHTAAAAARRTTPSGENGSVDAGVANPDAVVSLAEDGTQGSGLPHGAVAHPFEREGSSTASLLSPASETRDEIGVDGAAAPLPGTAAGGGADADASVAATTGGIRLSAGGVALGSGPGPGAGTLAAP